jgi:hypothetical protein
MGKECNRKSLGFRTNPGGSKPSLPGRSKGQHRPAKKRRHQGDEGEIPRTINTVAIQAALVVFLTCPKEMFYGK